MKYRKFGTTELLVSEVGFGAWAIGGAAKVGEVAIGWGETDDDHSILALRASLDKGINFFDTADFYGRGHSEELLGRELSKNTEVMIASKVGHRVSTDQSIYTDYSHDYIIQACDHSLRRLQRDHIDFYQLHTAKVEDLKNGEAIGALQDLQATGKIRYWGVSLNTFQPDPEATYLLNEHLGHGMQLVLNVLNQHALPIIKSAGKKGMGIIARMPLQFGVLTGKFSQQSKFPANDHRNSRISQTFITQANQLLTPFFQMAEKYGTSPAGLSISYVLGYPQISTVIPGMRNVEQVTENVDRVVDLSAADIDRIEQLYIHDFPPLLDQMKELG